MNCRELSDFLLDYVEGDLPVNVHTEFEGHIGRCADCQRFVTQYRATVRLSGAAYAGAHPTQMPDDLVCAIIEALKKS